jgi:hypothetical protein
MMTEEDIRALIVARLSHMDRCNSYYLNHLAGQLRGLVAVLTGEAPPSTSDGDVRSLLRAAGIPYEDYGPAHVHFPRAWCEAHGFVIDDSDPTRPEEERPMHHPRWSQSW